MRDRGLVRRRGLLASGIQLHRHAVGRDREADGAALLEVVAFSLADRVGSHAEIVQLALGLFEVGIAFHLERDALHAGRIGLVEDEIARIVAAAQESRSVLAHLGHVEAHDVTIELHRAFEVGDLHGHVTQPAVVETGFGHGILLRFATRLLPWRCGRD
jgi:hypothetical protein